MSNNEEPKKVLTHYEGTPNTAFERRVYASHKRLARSGYRSQVAAGNHDKAVVQAAEFFLKFGVDIEGNE